MSKVTLKATELVNTDVNFVSMVKRGANQIPFRIVKEDNEMLDLHKLGKNAFAKSEAPKTGGVFAALVRKDADNIEDLKAVLKDAGLSVENEEEGDGFLIFKQEGVDEFDVGTVQIGDDVALVVSGLKKGFHGYDFENTAFKDVFATEGFYPTLHTATSVFKYTVDNIMSKTEDKAQAATLIESALTEFSDLVKTITAAIPEACFKAEEALVKGGWGKDKDMKGKKKPKGDEEKGEGKEKAKKEEVSANPVNGNATSEQGKPGAANNDIEGSPTNGNDTPPASGGKQPNPGGATSNDVEGNPAVKQDDLLESFAKMLDGKLAEVSNGFNEAVEGLKKEVTAIETKLNGVAELAQKAEEAVNGTVLTDAHEERVTTKKSDTSKVPPLLDTAFMKAG